MIRINLLPWREQERIRKRHYWLRLMGLLIVMSLASVMVVHDNIQQAIVVAQQHITQLKQLQQRQQTRITDILKEHV